MNCSPLHIKVMVSVCVLSVSNGMRIPVFACVFYQSAMEWESLYLRVFYQSAVKWESLYLRVCFISQQWNENRCICVCVLSVSSEMRIPVFVCVFYESAVQWEVFMLTNSVLYLIIGPVRHRMLHVVDVAVAQRVIVDVDSPVPAHWDHIPVDGGAACYSVYMQDCSHLFS